MLPQPSTPSTAIKTLAQTFVRVRTHTGAQKQGALHYTWLNSSEWARRTQFFMSVTHLAHYDRLISNEVFIRESQVFNMSHISQPVPAKRPLKSKLHLAK